MKNRLNSYLIAIVMGIVSGLSIPMFRELMDKRIAGDFYMLFFNIEGFVFGIFSAPFIYFFLQEKSRKRKTFLWVATCGVSYHVAFLVGITFAPLAADADITTPVFAVMFGSAGLTGAIILLVGYRIFIGVIYKKWVLAILVFGMGIPAITVFFFEISPSGGWGIKAFPENPYMLIMMSLWQTFMLCSFTHAVLSQTKQLYKTKGVIA